MLLSGCNKSKPEEEQQLEPQPQLYDFVTIANYFDSLN